MSHLLNIICYFFFENINTVLSLLEAPGVKAMVRGASISHQKTKEIPIKHGNEGKYPKLGINLLKIEKKNCRTK